MSKGFRPGDVAGRPHPRGYLQASVDGVSYLLHRLAWFYETGAWPTKQIDHKDTIKTHNWFDNLRDVGGTTNQQNRKRANKNNAAGLLGVSTRRDPNGRIRYCSEITANGRVVRLGSHSTPEEAHLAFLAGKATHHEQAGG